MESIHTCAWPPQLISFSLAFLILIISIYTTLESFRAFSVVHFDIKPHSLQATHFNPNNSSP